MAVQTTDAMLVERGGVHYQESIANAGAALTATESEFIGKTAGTKLPSIEAMYNSYRLNDSNAAWGFSALGTAAAPAAVTLTTAIGQFSGFTSTGDRATLVGFSAGQAQTGFGSTCVGFRAGQNATNTYTTAIGLQCGQNNSGVDVDFMGTFAGQENTGNYTVGIGSQASQFNNQPDVTAIGRNAARYNQGMNFTGIGANAGSTNTADNNTALGADSLFTFTAGTAETVASVNTGTNEFTVTAHPFGAIGVRVNLEVNGTTAPAGLVLGGTYSFEVIDANTVMILGISVTSTGTAVTLAPNAATQYTNVTAVGYQATPDQSNQVVLGNASVTEVLTSGDLMANGVLTTSDERLKKFVTPISGALASVGAINGVTFKWNAESKGTVSPRSADLQQVGVLAQEVQAVYPEAVVERENGYLTVDYPKLVPLLIEAIKELKDKVETLEAIEIASA